MAYKHGVYTEEIPTALVAMTETDAGLIVAVGTAPVHLAADPQEASPARSGMCPLPTGRVQPFRRR